MNQSKSFYRPTCTDPMTEAEREFVAFIGAATELFGPEQGRLSAEDWLDELELMEDLPGSTSRDWRQVTIAASARLTSRLIAALHHRTPLVAPTDTKVSTPIPSSNCFASAPLM